MKEHSVFLIVIAILAATVAGVTFAIVDAGGARPAESFQATIVARHYQPDRVDYGSGVDSKGRYVSTSTHVPEAFTVFVESEQWSGPIGTSPHVFSRLKEGDAVRVTVYRGRITSWVKDRVLTLDR